ncbi:MAG: hypothetical protein OEY83_06890 [Candidatus Bathyarchaeota archaeon]|nr:hypothetical protein [Candidatus Bathyarchaeota archaeon]
MKKLAATHLLLTLLITLVTPVHASVKMQATIDQNIHVVFIFEDINSTIYSEAKQTFNITTIPKAIIKSLEQQGLTRARWGYDPEQEIVFNDSARSMRVEFYLAGSDIINFTFNKTTMNRIYHVQTEWRKFHVNLAQNFSLDFAQYFDVLVANWTYSDPERTYHYECTEPDSLDPSCKIVLPRTATNVHATEDTITFEVPPLPEDILLNSPFLILGALIVVIIIAFLYRRLRK